MNPRHVVIFGGGDSQRSDNNVRPAAVSFFHCAAIFSCSRTSSGVHAGHAVPGVDVREALW